MPAAWLSGKLSRSAWSTDPAAVKWEEALGGGAAREREKQRNPVSFPDVHNYRTAPWLPPYRLGRARREETSGSCFALSPQRGAEQNAENRDKRHFPPQQDQAGWVGTNPLTLQRPIAPMAAP